MSLMGKAEFSKRNRMRYRFMMQLFGLRLDKKQWERDFGCSVAAGLPAEYMFMKMSGAFDVDNDEEITLTPKGRYLMVVMMRQFFIGVTTYVTRLAVYFPKKSATCFSGRAAQ